MRQLAVFGDPPSFSAPLHVGRPNIGDRDKLMERIEGALDRRWLTNNGPLVQEFEVRLADYLGVEHCIAMCNATVALEILIRAAGLKGEVIVPAFTFVATAHALQWQEITPVFADVDPKTHNLDPDRVEAMITPRTTGIIGVHVWGRPCDTDALQDIADRHGLRLMFDAAHAFGNSHQGRMLGGFGDAEVFSFHATKFFNSFEGGAVTTNDADLARTIRLMKNFGFAGTDSVIYVGTNGKMSEVSAAMGLTSLDAINDIIEVNRRNYESYREALGGLPGLSVIDYDDGERRNYQYVIVEVDERQAGLTRDELVDVLWAENVLARRYFYPGVHKMEPYASYFPHAGRLLPETDALSECVMSVPTGTAVDADDIAMISQIVAAALADADSVRRALAHRAELDPPVAAGGR